MSIPHAGDESKTSRQTAPDQVGAVQKPNGGTEPLKLFPPSPIPPNSLGLRPGISGVIRLHPPSPRRPKPPTGGYKTGRRNPPKENVPLGSRLAVLATNGLALCPVVPGTLPSPREARQDLRRSRSPGIGDVSQRDSPQQVFYRSQIRCDHVGAIPKHAEHPRTVRTGKQPFDRASIFDIVQIKNMASQPT
jgi:hypothetical protein